MRPIQILKRTVKAAIGRDFFPTIDVHYPNQLFGSGYGGWSVISQLLNPSSVIYSFGIGEDATFDLELINHIGVTVHAFDPTPRSIEWVHKQYFSQKFVLHEYGLANFDGTALFYPPKKTTNISYTINAKSNESPITLPVKRLTTIVHELGHERIDLLKADIEGAEYQFIDDLETGAIRPTQLLIEFHHRFSGIGLSQTKHALKQLRAIGYALFSVSDSGQEFGFIQTDTKSNQDLHC